MTRPAHPQPGTTSMVLVFAFANLGRAANVGQVWSSIVKIRDFLLQFGHAIVLGLNEIDEGDQGYNDHQLVRRGFTRKSGWHRSLMTKREPILTHGLRVTWRHWVRACAGLAHQTPGRSVQETIEDLGDGQPELATLCLHDPAGAYNGHRPSRIKAILLRLYAQVVETEEQRIDRHHKAGRHVVVLADRNSRRYRATGHPRAVVVHAPGSPDYIVVIPAPGWTWITEDHDVEPLFVERIHGLLWVSGHFAKETR